MKLGIAIFATLAMWLIIAYLAFPGAIENNLRKASEFYVDAEHGNDDWSGTLPTPSYSGDDGPFKTLNVAVIRIRLQRISTFKNVTLFVRQGIYFVKQAIILDSKDSHLSIVNYPGDARALISGAYKLSGKDFFLYDHKIYAAPFPGKCSQHVFLGDKRLVRARKPNLKKWHGNDLTGQGPYLTIKDLLQPTPDCNRQGSGGFTQRHCSKDNEDGFVFQEGDIDPRWSNIQTGEILVFEAWTAERRQMKKISIGNRINFTRPLLFPVGMHPKPSGWRYIVENIYEELDATGEFFCDEKTHMLYIIPPVGALDVEDVYVSSTETLFKVVYTKNIRFSGLDFRHTSYESFTKTRFATLPGALEFERTDGIVIDDNNFLNVGYTGIYIISCINVEISENIFRDIGNFGISTDYENNPFDLFANKNIFINNNTFEGCGVVAMLQPSCVFVKGMGQIHIKDNEISRTSYAGIRVGWQQTFTASFVPEGKFIFYIERNNIHSYGMRILNDFGGVYLSSNPSCGSAHRVVSKCHLHAYVAQNTIHHSLAYQYGSMGIYGDTAVSSLTVEKNWLYNLGETAINFHCGQHNFALNNMIHHVSYSRVFGTCNKVLPGRLPKQILTFKRNVLYVANNRSRMFGRSDIWVHDVPKVNNNIYYFHPLDQTQFDEFFPKYRSWDAWRQETKNDLDSEIVNPHFWNIKIHDYRLRNISSAFQLGIESVDLRSVQDRVEI